MNESTHTYIYSFQTWIQLMETIIFQVTSHYWVVCCACKKKLFIAEMSQLGYRRQYFQVHRSSVLMLTVTETIFLKIQTQKWKVQYCTFGLCVLHEQCTTYQPHPRFSSRPAVLEMNFMVIFSLVSWHNDLDVPVSILGLDLCSRKLKEWR